MSTTQRFIFLLSCLLLPLWADPSHAQAEDAAPSPSLTYREALERVLASDPRIALLNARLEEAEGLAEQAALALNPSLEAEVENLLGSGPFEGLDAAEATITYVQELETAGKRRLRTAAAEGEREATRIGLDALRLSIASETRTAFDRVVLAQRWLDLRQRERDLAIESLEETRRLLEAARVSATETARAELAAQERKFRVRRAEREALAAREALASLWGEAADTGFRAEDAVEILAPPPLEALEALLPAHPDLSRLEALRSVREAERDLDEAKGTPNMELFAGARHFREEDGDTAFLVGFGLPLPLFDRNQGNIRAAAARLRMLDAETEALQRDLRLGIRAAWRALSSAFADATELGESLLPAAEEALAQTREGYREGRYPLLNVLESRQALYDVQEAELEALERAVQAQADLERLTASSLANRSNR